MRLRQDVEGRRVDPQAASAAQLGTFETEPLADLNGQRIDRFHGLKLIVLDMDSSVSLIQAINRVATDDKKRFDFILAPKSIARKTALTRAFVVRKIE